MVNKEKEVNKKSVVSKNVQKKAMKNFMDEFFQPLDNFDLKKNLPKLHPSTELKEDQSAYYLRIELPGFQRDSFKIQVSKDKISIYAEKITADNNEQAQTKKLHISDISYGVFSKNYSFSSLIDPEKSSAKFTDGLLNIVMPKLIAVEKTFFLKFD